MKGTTKSGFQYEVRDNIKKDYRFIKAYKTITKPKNETESITAVDDFINIILGEEGCNALMEHIAEKDGFVDIEKMMSEISEILSYVGKQESEIKKLLSSQTQ